MKNDFKKKIRDNAKNMGVYENFPPKEEKKNNYQKKKKPTPVTYVVGAMHTQSMDSTIKTLKYILPDEVLVLFPDMDHEYTVAAATYAVIAGALLITPSLETKKFIHTSVSASVNKASMKFESGVGFSWEVKYTIENGTAKVDEVKLKITLYNPSEQKDIIHALENHYNAQVVEDKRNRNR